MGFGWSWWVLVCLPYHDNGRGGIATLELFEGEVGEGGGGPGGQRFLIIIMMIMIMIMIMKTMMMIYI